MLATPNNYTELHTLPQVRLINGPLASFNEAARNFMRPTVGKAIAAGAVAAAAGTATAAGTSALVLGGAEAMRIARRLAVMHVHLKVGEGSSSSTQYKQQ